MVPQRILLVDDDPMLVHLLARTLQKHGYVVDTAVDGQDGLEKALALHPDLLVLDVMMPRMNGYEVCHHLRCHPETAETPILIITSLGSAGGPAGSPAPTHTDAIHHYRQRALAAGANDFLAKPVRPQALLERIQQVRQNAPIAQ
ncbi:MAG: response regulator [Ardenticatenaceae bacterium]|nr:response regulator [Ardenticatenaceae bacterium]